VETRDVTAHVATAQRGERLALLSENVASTAACDVIERATRSEGKGGEARRASSALAKHATVSTISYYTFNVAVFMTHQQL
jgi:hypothetical protein